MASKLTPKEIELMATVVNSGQVTVSDWNTIAKAAKYSTGKYARDTWTTIKKKLAADMPQGGDDADSSAGNDIAADAVQTPKKPAAKKKATPTPRKRKAKAVEEPKGDGGDSESDFAQPLTKKRTARTPKKQAKSAEKVEEADDADDGNEVGVEEELVKSESGDEDVRGQVDVMVDGIANGIADAGSPAEDDGDEV